MICFVSADELDLIINQQMEKTINKKLEELNKTKSLLNDYIFEYVEDKFVLKNIKFKNNKDEEDEEDGEEEEKLKVKTLKK